MNMEDIDYEPDVLKFKQIWKQMRETKDQNNPPNRQKNSNQSATKLKKKSSQRMSEEPRQTKKQTVISQKNVTRNPKRDNEEVIQVITRPNGGQQNTLKNQKDFIRREDYVQSFNSPTLQNQVDFLKKAVSEKDYELSLLRVSNTRSEDRIRVLEDEIAKRDDRISQLERRERQLLSRANSLTGNEKLFDYGQVEYQNFRNDSRRLLKMLQTTAEYQQFANLGLDDNGIRFLNEVNKKSKSFVDTNAKTKLHFCTCNKDFIPQSGFWVPQKVYDYAKSFVKERKGQMTNAELELLLYDLNKIWRERQKRIINTMNSQKAKQVGKLKRKISSTTKTNKINE